MIGFLTGDYPRRSVAVLAVADKPAIGASVIGALGKSINGIVGWAVDSS
jgi:hypothetical protein